MPARKTPPRGKIVTMREARSKVVAYAKLLWVFIQALGGFIWSSLADVLSSVAKSKDVIQTVGTLVAICFSGWALYYSSRSISYTENDFHLRHRPYLTMASDQPTLGGPIMTAEGRVYQHALFIKVLNLSDTPAQNVSLVADVFVDDKLVNTEITSSKTLGHGSMLAIFRGNEFSFKVSILDKTFALLSNSNHTIHVEARLNYLGILKERSPYTTKIRFDYWPPSQTWDVSQQEIE
jgi:hypothetical protein